MWKKSLYVFATFVVALHAFAAWSEEPNYVLEGGRKFEIDYHKTATQWAKDGFGRPVGPGSLIETVKDTGWQKDDLARFKINSADDALQAVKSSCAELFGTKLDENELLLVTDLRKWRRAGTQIVDSYAWCVSWIQVDSKTLYPRVKNCIWIDAASGAIKVMRGMTQASNKSGYQNADGNLLPMLADSESIGDSISARLKASKVPLPSEVIKWETEQGPLPTPNLGECPYVYRLVSLAEDDEDFGRDGDLVWIVHNGPGSYEFRGEKWVNARTGVEIVFSVRDWEKTHLNESKDSR